MLEKLLQILYVNCRHKKMSQPFSAAASGSSPSAEWESVGQPASHYVVCLECGRKFQYDWQNMRIVH